MPPSASVTLRVPAETKDFSVVDRGNIGTSWDGSFVADGSTVVRGWLEGGATDQNWSKVREQQPHSGTRVKRSGWKADLAGLRVATRTIEQEQPMFFRQKQMAYHAKPEKPDPL